MKGCNILLIALGWFPLWTAQAGPLQITLLPGAALQSDAVVLARLQPTDFAAGTRKSAGHALTKAELGRAIRAALAQKGSPLAEQISEDGLQLETEVFVPDDNPGIALTGITYDRALHSARFRLRLNALPKAPPFYAWCTLNTWEYGRHVSAAVPRVRLQDDPAVSPRRMACLHLHSENYSALLQVRSMQPGNDGDTVRVRLPGNGKILRATIVGKDRLDARF